MDLKNSRLNKPSFQRDTFRGDTFCPSEVIGKLTFKIGTDILQGLSPHTFLSEEFETRKVDSQVYSLHLCAPRVEL